MLKLLALVLAGAQVLVAADKIVGGPMVVNPTPRSATVVWIVQNDELTLQPPAGQARKSPSLRVEQTTLTGLQPNTRYEYNASGQEAGKGSFKTPPTGSEPYRFVAYGDNRTRPDVHRQGSNTLGTQGTPDFVVQTGDMVDNGEDSSLWPIFFDIEKELLRHTVFFPALGNHERNAHEFFDYRSEEHTSELQSPCNL